jgi:hypothetical protein
MTYVTALLLAVVVLLGLLILEIQRRMLRVLRDLTIGQYTLWEKIRPHKERVRQ